MSTPENFSPAMDHRDHHFQSLSCCNKLYNFFMKTLLAYALKPVTLGHSLHHNLDCKAKNETTIETDQMLHSQNQTSSEEGKEETKITTNSFMIENTEGNVNGDSRKDDDEKKVEAMASVVVSQKKAPKKVVSINERVEEIPTKQKLRRKKSTEKLNSFEFQEDENKPLKSILKVGSNLGDRSNSFVCPAIDG